MKLPDIEYLIGMVEVEKALGTFANGMLIDSATRAYVTENSEKYLFTCTRAGYLYISIDREWKTILGRSRYGP